MPDNAAASPLTLAVDRSGAAAVVRCSGRLVSGVSDLLYVQVKQLIPDCKRIVLDLQETTHMDSSGLGTVVRLYASAKSAGCALELANIGKPVRYLLGVTHLISVLTIIGENNIRMG
jgi:anti-sigma B factor antagonist